MAGAVGPSVSQLPIDASSLQKNWALAQAVVALEHPEALEAIKEIFRGECELPQIVEYLETNPQGYATLENIVKTYNEQLLRSEPLGSFRRSRAPESGYGSERSDSFRRGSSASDAWGDSPQIGRRNSISSLRSARSRGDSDGSQAGDRERANRIIEELPFARPSLLKEILPKVSKSAAPEDPKELVAFISDKLQKKAVRKGADQLLTSVEGLFNPLELMWCALRRVMAQAKSYGDLSLRCIEQALKFRIHPLFRFVNEQTRPLEELVYRGRPIKTLTTQIGGLIDLCPEEKRGELIREIEILFWRATANEVGIQLHQVATLKEVQPEDKEDRCVLSTTKNWVEGGMENCAQRLTPTWSVETIKETMDEIDKIASAMPTHIKGDEIKKRAEEPSSELGAYASSDLALAPNLANRKVQDLFAKVEDPSSVGECAAAGSALLEALESGVNEKQFQTIPNPALKSVRVGLARVLGYLENKVLAKSRNVGLIERYTTLLESLNPEIRKKMLPKIGSLFETFCSQNRLRCAKEWSEENYHEQLDYLNEQMIEQRLFVLGKKIETFGKLAGPRVHEAEELMERYVKVQQFVKEIAAFIRTTKGDAVLQFWQGLASSLRFHGIEFSFSEEGFSTCSSVELAESLHNILMQSDSGVPEALVVAMRRLISGSDNALEEESVERRRVQEEIRKGRSLRLSTPELYEELGKEHQRPDLTQRENEELRTLIRCALSKCTQKNRRILERVLPELAARACRQENTAFESFALPGPFPHWAKNELNLHGFYDSVQDGVAPDELLEAPLQETYGFGDDPDFYGMALGIDEEGGYSNLGAGAFGVHNEVGTDARPILQLEPSVSPLSQEARVQRAAPLSNEGAVPACAVTKELISYVIPYYGKWQTVDYKVSGESFRWCVELFKNAKTVICTVPEPEIRQLGQEKAVWQKHVVEYIKALCSVEKGPMLPNCRRFVLALPDKISVDISAGVYRALLDQLPRAEVIATPGLCVNLNGERSFLDALAKKSRLRSLSIGLSARGDQEPSFKTFPEQVTEWRVRARFPSVNRVIATEGAEEAAQLTEEAQRKGDVDGLRRAAALRSQTELEKMYDMRRELEYPVMSQFVSCMCKKAKVVDLTCSGVLPMTWMQEVNESGVDASFSYVSSETEGYEPSAPSFIAACREFRLSPAVGVVPGQAVPHPPGVIALHRALSPNKVEAWLQKLMSLRTAQALRLSDNQLSWGPALISILRMCMGLVVTEATLRDLVEKSRGELSFDKLKERLKIAQPLAPALSLVSRGLQLSEEFQRASLRLTAHSDERAHLAAGMAIFIGELVVKDETTRVSLAKWLKENGGKEGLQLIDLLHEITKTHNLSAEELDDLRKSLGDIATCDKKTRPKIVEAVLEIIRNRRMSLLQSMLDCPSSVKELDLSNNPLGEITGELPKVLLTLSERRSSDSAEEEGSGYIDVMPGSVGDDEVYVAPRPIKYPPITGISNERLPKAYETGEGLILALMTLCPQLTILRLCNCGGDPEKVLEACKNFIKPGVSHLKTLGIGNERWSHGQVESLLKHLALTEVTHLQIPHSDPSIVELVDTWNSNRCESHGRIHLRQSVSASKV